MKDEAPLEKIIALAEKFILIPSQTGNNKRVNEILALTKEVLQDFEPTLYTSQDTESLLFSSKDKEVKKFKIILNAHLDVVPGKPEQFVPYTENRKLYGRGAYDMKAAAAIMVILFKEMANKLEYPLGLQIVTDEEMVSGLGTSMQLDSGVETEFAVIGECGSNLDIIYENKGIIHATITTSGITAHGAYPWKGINAITKMHEVISKIHQYFPTPESETFDTTVTISQITTANNMWNQIPEKCTATLDIRTSREKHNTILTKITSLLPKDVLIEVIKTRTPHYTDPNNKYITLLGKSAKQVIGKDLRKRKTYGGSDATFFSEAGYDAIEFGPIGEGQHHDEEWVDIKSLGDYYQILKQFLLSIK